MKLNPWNLKHWGWWHHFLPLEVWSLLDKYKCLYTFEMELKQVEYQKQNTILVKANFVILNLHPKLLHYFLFLCLFFSKRKSGANDPIAAKRPNSYLGRKKFIQGIKQCDAPLLNQPQFRWLEKKTVFEHIFRAQYMITGVPITRNVHI